ncbi:MAG: folylpolyglutamate synthase/dihydrofolate synthase family protein [Planctomycetota bacterium]|nr:folylpolyglutamate synthase/dihydrofolate synthase family protein [Planctomycetota bacterium]
MSRGANTTRRSGRRADVSPAEITTYPTAVRYLYDRMDLERMRVVRYDTATFKLDRMRALMDALGNPHQQVRMVHIAGTVGKGSTAAMIASMLEGCGYAVGQYTSPHLVDVRERITINGQLIPRTEFTELMRQAAEAAEAIKETPTFFELATAVAFKYFAEQAVDFAVIETGLGGRLDSTNIITPEATVITRIDFDHTHILGRKLEQIAGEKAGIIKRGVPVITFEQVEEVDRTIRARAEEIGAPLRIVGKDIEYSFRFGASPDLGPHCRVCIVTPTSHFMHLPVPLPGEHQAINCGLALAVIDQLKASGFDCPEVPMLEGLGRTRTPGRMELVWDRPRILVDGAHNPASLAALMRCVGAHVPYDSMVCVFGCCEDKDVKSMLEKASLGGDKIIFTRAKGNPRALDPEELKRQFAELSGKMCQVARTLPEALDLATRAVGRDDLICVTGSFYLVGETKKFLADLERKRQQQKR